jgi:hypothetical protein
MNQNELREYLFQKDLVQEKEMDKLIRDAQPKKVNDDYKLKLYKTPIITRDLIGPEYVAEKQLMDLSLDLQLQNMVKQANYAISDKKPEAMKGSVTEEMIAEYKKEVMKPVEIGGKYRLYRPVEIPPPLKKPDPIPYDHKGAYITEAEAQRKAGKIINDINKFEAELDRLNDLKKRLEDRFTLSSTAFDEALIRDTLDKLLNPALEQIIKDKGLPMPKSKTKANLIKAIVDAEKGVIENVKTDLGKVGGDIIRHIDLIKDAKIAFEAVVAEFNRQADVDEENRLNLIEYENKKRQIAQEALGDFNRLNQGKIQVARQPNETDDDFITRLQQMGNIFIDPADMDKQIITEILLKAKTNILELTNDYAKAESVTRMLNNNERFQMNKTFPRIKKKYSETFGLNNKDMDANEMAQFVKNELDTGVELTSVPEEGSTQDFNKKVRMFSKDQLITYIDELNKDPAANLLTGSDKFSKADMVKELVSKSLFDPKNIRMVLKLPIPEDTIFPVVPTGLISEVPTGTAETKDDEEEDFEDSIDEMTAAGIKNHVLPSTVPFGKIALDLNKLFYQNVLSIKRHNGNKIIGHKNKRVSDNFVDIIMKMFENKPITQSDLKNIKDEQMLYDNLIVQSGLHKLKKIPTNIEQTSEQMKNRLGLITGEIEAGNSNKALLTELHELLFKMVRVHLISKNAAAAYYKNIKDNFFTL